MYNELFCFVSAKSPSGDLGARPLMKSVASCKALTTDHRPLPTFFKLPNNSLTYKTAKLH
ncbi:MAG: hypothetical protein K0R51_2940 [Cytophagaceae bacterium]|jgi:hypothetical protein|nr:hypothetical protein [Cytophagaceae bacterium]